MTVFKPLEMDTISADSVNGGTFTLGQDTFEASGNSPDNFREPNVLFVCCATTVFLYGKFDGTATTTSKDFAIITHGAKDQYIALPAGVRKVHLLSSGATAIVAVGVGWVRKDG